jgi:ribosome biogenesis GTPase A
MAQISYETVASKKEYSRQRRGLDSLLQEADVLIGSAPFRIFSHWKRQRVRRQRWERHTFKLAVMGLMKSGKSTLINSWLGDELLPMSSLPETAHIITIQQQPGLINALLKKHGKTRAIGVSNIHKYLRKLNAQFREPGLPLQDYELTLKIPSIPLVNHRLGKQSLHIFDTPSPNEAGMGQLWQKITSIIHTVDAIVYLLDYTKLKTTQEQNILADLAARRPDLLKNGCIFFVINKIDAATRHSQTYEETVRYVAALLQHQLPGLTINDDQILLVAAEQALLARLVLNGHASAQARHDFLQKVFGQRAKDEEEDLSPDHLQSAAFKLLKMSRIEQVEEAILTRLQARKEQLLFAELLHDLQTSLTMFSVDLQAMHEQLITRQARFTAKMSSENEQPRGVTRSHSKSLIAETMEIQSSHRSQRILALEERLSQVDGLLEEISFYCQDVALGNSIIG